MDRRVAAVDSGERGSARGTRGGEDGGDKSRGGGLGEVVGGSGGSRSAMAGNDRFAVSLCVVISVGGSEGAREKCGGEGRDRGRGGMFPQPFILSVSIFRCLLLCLLLQLREGTPGKRHFFGFLGLGTGRWKGGRGKGKGRGPVWSLWCDEVDGLL